MCSSPGSTPTTFCGSPRDIDNEASVGPVSSTGMQPVVRDAMLSAIPKLRAIAMALCRSRDRADDLVQETLLRGIASIRLFEAGTNMEGWLATILRNQFRSEWRWRRKETEDVDGCYAETLTAPAKQHERVEFEELRMALAKLPYDQREIVILVIAAGFSYDEAATICGCAMGTIKSRLNRARIRLAQLLEA